MGVQAKVVEFNGVEHALDQHGHLLRADDWCEGLASHLAQIDGLQLGDHHWRVLHHLRDHHRRHGEPPRMRALVAAMAPVLGDSGSRTLYRLFPQGPIRQACRYAGLPRPSRCI